MAAHLVGCLLACCLLACAPATTVQATLVRAEPSVIAFRNLGSAKARVRQYRLVWPGGAKTVDADFVVPAGGTVERRVRLDAVTPAAIQVEVVLVERVRCL